MSVEVAGSCRVLRHELRVRPDGDDWIVGRVDTGEGGEHRGADRHSEAGQGGDDQCEQPQRQLSRGPAGAHGVPETSPRIARLLHDLRAGGAPVLAEFWREVAARGTPLIERVDGDSALVTFLRHGSPALPTAATGRGPTHLDALNHHPFRFPADPADPNDQVLWASLLELPKAPDEPWIRRSRASGSG